MTYNTQLEFAYGNDEQIQEAFITLCDDIGEDMASVLFEASRQNLRRVKMQHMIYLCEKVKASLGIDFDGRMVTVRYNKVA